MFQFCISAAEKGKFEIFNLLQQSSSHPTWSNEEQFDQMYSLVSKSNNGEEREEILDCIVDGKNSLQELLNIIGKTGMTLLGKACQSGLNKVVSKLLLQSMDNLCR